MTHQPPSAQQTLALVRVQLPPHISSVYTLTQAAVLGGVHPDMLRYYCQIGLVRPTSTFHGTDPSFDDTAVYELRRFEYYRRHQGISRRTLRIIWALRHEIDRLKTELHFLRKT
jgi:DNA-binding transcriptional MerR regulator